MKKRSMLALLLAGVVCWNSSSAMAESYNVTHENVSNGTVTTHGVLNAPNEFHATTQWTTGGTVGIYAATFTIPAGEDDHIIVEDDNVSGNGTCSISQTYGEFRPLIGLYKITKVDFAHTVHSQSQQLLYYSRTLEAM